MSGNNDSLTLTGNGDSVTSTGFNNTVNFDSNNASLSVTANGDTININGNGNTVTVAGFSNTLVLGGNNDTFVFNFASVGQEVVKNFNVATDQIDFNNSIFSNAHAVLNATHDVNGNAVITIDAALHETITLAGIHTAQLHLSDFSIV